jgi:pimeloyl-ACP methyl ester carboxylesterase
MRLYYRELGEGEPLVILHGLYGSSDNWMSIGRELSSKYRVILVDQRNHGQSPHHNSHTYSDLALDLHDLFDLLQLREAIIIGHSMGGKVAMLFAAQYPNMVKALIVVDILPYSYREDVDVGYTQEHEHRKILAALQQVNPHNVKSRQELDDNLSIFIPNLTLRQFILKSIKRTTEGNFEWRINVDVLSKSISRLMESVLSDKVNPIQIPTLFVKGQNSNYITLNGEKLLPQNFSNYQLVVISNAGHWLHAENPQGFLSALNSFLDRQ